MTLQKIIGRVIVTIALMVTCKAETLSFYVPSHDIVMKVDLEALANGDPADARNLFNKVWRSREQPNMEEIVQKAGRAIARNKRVESDV